MDLTQTIASASSIMEDVLLVDLIDIETMQTSYDDEGFPTSEFTTVAAGVSALVQGITDSGTPQEGLMTKQWSIKVSKRTSVNPGVIIKVVESKSQPDMAGFRILVDEVSHQGMALIRKCIGQGFHAVDPQGKDGLRNV